MPERCGYEVKITRDRDAVSLPYGVHVRRLSDGATACKVFSWAWTARRFARSQRRIAAAVRNEPQDRSSRGVETVERFTIEYQDWPAGVSDETEEADRA